MRKMIMMLTIVALAITMGFGQVSPDTSSVNVGRVAVLDSTVINDMKLLIVADRLYAKNGLIEALVQQASKEKAETGKISKQSAVQSFIDNINSDYDKFLKRFIKVDTIWIDPLDVNSQISNITEWQQSVLLDPEIKSATSLGVWEEKDVELKRLQRLQRQLVK